ncbi:mechanosensitive ion channel family protein [Natroniella sulfidigena]|uniref:mechanosensitive ion channel family protein n=1 Tax=Natroniella sulfidigena TaxID=723921 RepID=UPI00200B8CE5|nr:mechanosensitive ion channel family protein [Natroniella sulfidigena]MCK8816639.1 mechanosensitive ion channel family protein [Natroniella sulfidigena]
MDRLSNVLDRIFKLATVDLLSAAILQQIGLAFLQLAAILVATKLLLRFGYFLIERLFEEREGYGKYTKQRNKTLNFVLKSALRYSIYFIGGTMALDVVGVPTSSILAGAGVVGLALGFGAQNLVKDVITGFFILFEKQFVVGDYVKIAEVEGIVKEIGLRVTKIKNFDGDLHIIPNGNIEQVTNFSTEARRVVVNAPIDYDQSIEEAIDVLEQLSSELKEEYQQIKEGPTVQGVDKLGDSSVEIRVIAMVDPMDSWQIGRVIKQRIKERFDQVGIAIPYQHLTIVNKE